jgi:hypothetical protein
MGHNINTWNWLLKEVGSGTEDQTGIPGSVPQTDPNMPPPPGNEPNIANQPQNMPGQGDEGPADDPQIPDMPDDMGETEKDFESWKKEFIVESIKGDVATLKQMILDIRERDFDSYQFKFVEDNLQILFLREYSNIDKVSKEIRKLIKEELDHNNPSTSMVNHMSEVLNKEPLLKTVFVKLSGLRGLKGECHRGFIAALFGAVQVSSGAASEDLVLSEKDYAIRISTRMNSRFGDIHLGQWSPRTDDPERYLKPPELKMLEEGAPEERDVLRKRIMIESIAQEFKERAFVINVVGTDGTVYTLGWDIATSIRSAYKEGKLVIRTNDNSASEAMITADGEIIPLVDIKVMYVQNSGETDENNKPVKQEVEFMARRFGQLFLTAQLPVVKEASSAMQGIVFKQMPYDGNISDIKVLRRCVPSLPSMVMRQC